MKDICFHCHWHGQALYSRFGTQAVPDPSLKKIIEDNILLLGHPSNCVFNGPSAIPFYTYIKMIDLI